MFKGSRHTNTLVFGLFTLLALVAAEEGAGQIMAVGGHVSMNQDISVETTWGVGARAHLSMPLTGVTLQGTLDFFSPDCDPLDCEFREASVNLLWTFPVPMLAKPYLGVGLAAQNSEGDWGLGDDSDYGANFIGGIILQGPAFSRLQPFGEVKYQLMQDFDPQTVFSFGLMLGLF